MPEYIDKGKLLDTLQQCLRGANFLGKHEDANIYASVVSLVDEQPAADVAPVVRCRECIHRVNMEHSMDNKEICCGRMAMRVVALDDYCSHGVRMDGGEHHAD